MCKYVARCHGVAWCEGREAPKSQVSQEGGILVKMMTGMRRKLSQQQSVAQMERSNHCNKKCV